MPARRVLVAFGGLALLQAAAPAQVPPLPPLDGAPGVAPAEESIDASAFSLSLSNTRSLDFGRFVAGSGGTITISPIGTRSRTGGVILMNSAGAGQARFSLQTSNDGSADQAVVVSLPANGEVSLTNGRHSMPVQHFVNGSGNLMPLSAGNATLEIGATLTVAPNQAPGHYTGAFRLTVNYQ